MNKTTKTIRILLGLMMLIFGLNGFFQFIPMPAPSPEMGNFVAALAATGYILPLVAIIQIVVGILLLINKFAPLALVVLAPIMLNAFLAHLFLHDIGGIGAAAIANGFIAFLFFAYRHTYFELLTPAHYENTQQ